MHIVSYLWLADRKNQALKFWRFFTPHIYLFPQILELTSQYSNLRHEMERARRELEKHNTAREMKKSTSRVSVSSPISDTEMSSQMEMDQLKQQCTDLQSQNDVS